MFALISLVDGALGRFLGFWGVFNFAAFSIGGPEFVAMCSSEAERPRVTIPKAIRCVCLVIPGLFCGRWTKIHSTDVAGFVIDFDVEFVFGYEGGCSGAWLVSNFYPDRLHANGVLSGEHDCCLVEQLSTSSAFSALVFSSHTTMKI